MNLLAAILAATPLWQQPTPLMQQHFGAELPTIVEAALANDCHSDQLFTVLLAIRKAEKGGHGREFGILHPRALNQARSLRVQAGWCAATIRKNYERWIKANDGRDFIQFLGDRYCPVGADNDPDDLNTHWKGNVRFWVVRLAGPLQWLKSAKSVEHPHQHRIYSLLGNTVFPTTTKGRDHGGTIATS
jgi:hypothetical protein